MRSKTMRMLRAVTLTELLVVLVIISLLATIAVPVYINQIQRARVSVAQTEVRQIAEAQQSVAISHGFYVPIHILNNVPNLSGSTGFNTNRDDFNNMSAVTRYLVDGFRSLEDQFQDAQQTTIDRNSTNPRVIRLINEWQGPFLQPKRVRYLNEVVGNVGTGDYTFDFVVDPWGNPYRFYSEFGRLGSDTQQPNSNNAMNSGMDDLRLISGFEPDRFDRYAIVSYGADGRTGFTTNNSLIQGDDVFYAFSGVPSSETVYQNF